MLAFQTKRDVHCDQSPLSWLEKAEGRIRPKFSPTKRVLATSLPKARLLCNLESILCIIKIDDYLLTYKLFVN